MKERQKKIKWEPHLHLNSIRKPGYLVYKSQACFSQESVKMVLSVKQVVMSLHGMEE